MTPSPMKIGYEIDQHRDKKCFLEKRFLLFGSF